MKNLQLISGIQRQHKKLPFRKSVYPALLGHFCSKATFKAFFQQAKIHPNASLIKGVVCGYRVEEIPDEFQVYKRCRYMEKLIDELAKGRKMDRILRKA